MVSNDSSFLRRATTESGFDQGGYGELQYTKEMLWKATRPSSLMGGGDRLCPRSNSSFDKAAMGCIMKAGNKYYGLTAGHALAKDGPD
jgi:hypothetical protein